MSAGTLPAVRDGSHVNDMRQNMCRISALIEEGFASIRQRHSDRKVRPAAGRDYFSQASREIGMLKVKLNRLVEEGGAE